MVELTTAVATTAALGLAAWSTGSAALEHNGPALVEVQIARQELSMSPTITPEQMRGFRLFMLRAVLDGRGDELIDLARVNVFR